MKALRIIAILVTAGTMLVGGVLLTTSGRPAVVALGVFAAAVGAYYAFAGLSVERTMTSASTTRVSGPATPETHDDQLGASAQVFAGHASNLTS